MKFRRTQYFARADCKNEESFKILLADMNDYRRKNNLKGVARFQRDYTAQRAQDDWRELQYYEHQHSVKEEWLVRESEARYRNELEDLDLLMASKPTAWEIEQAEMRTHQCHNKLKYDQKYAEKHTWLMKWIESQIGEIEREFESSGLSQTTPLREPGSTALQNQNKRFASAFTSFVSAFMNSWLIRKLESEPHRHKDETRQKQRRWQRAATMTDSRM